MTPNTRNKEVKLAEVNKSLEDSFNPAKKFRLFSCPSKKEENSETDSDV